MTGATCILSLFFVFSRLLLLPCGLRAGYTPSQIPLPVFEVTASFIGVRDCVELRMFA
ncbi:hypothetical protein P389DRAFT_171170 [Cystobasidium minutum MCA 4210]|uniref:uncharacterized protein n=1 Tax=Cystobasidium minutum MCA 4210 TaxID=1397322 RepID=UPI0034CECA86|eukprot:jgi/Rhomi1/171170/fgenesh1_kg.4_\